MITPRPIKQYDLRNLNLALSMLGLWLMLSNNWLFVPVALLNLYSLSAEGQTVISTALESLNPTSLALVLSIVWIWLFFGNNWLYLPVAVVTLSLSHLSFKVKSS
jgi:hypothetical protein